MNRLLSVARRGRSGVLLLVGEPGVGKSALLDHAARRARGWTVLRASGTESEAELPFAGLAELLGPVVDGLADIPPVQSAALAGALAIEERQSRDHFTIYAGTLSLLGWAAASRSVLVLIDDPQWLDVSSQNAISFACRRLVAENVAVFVATRPEPANAFTQSSLPRLELTGIDASAGRRLLTKMVPVPMPPAVVSQLVAASAGNPLALRESARTLSPEQLRGEEPLPDPLPLPSDLRALFFARIARQPGRTRRALLLAAANTGPRSELSDALTNAGLSWHDLQAAQAAGIVDARDVVRFDHPLVRAAVYHDARVDARRAAHLALAKAAEVTGDAARRAWHLATAADGPDEAVAAALDDAASWAGARGAHAVAATTYEKAATLSPGPEHLARTVKAAAEHMLAGQPDRSLMLLDRARHQAPDSLSRAEIDHLRGRVLIARGPLDLAQQVLAESAARVADRAPDKAAAMLADAALACFVSSRIPLGESYARRAWALIGERPDREGEVVHLLFTGMLVMGGRAREAAEHVELERHRLLELRAARVWQPLVLASIWLMWAEELDLVTELLSGAIEEARQQSSPALLPLALAQQSELLWRRGEWTHAYASATEAASLARETGQQVVLSYAEACTALALAATGRNEECRNAAARAVTAAEAVGSDSAVPRTDAALGLLELSNGNLPGATTALLSAQTLLRAHGVLEPTVIPCAADLVEALIGAGRLAEARAELDWLEASATVSGRRWTTGVVHRLHGMLAPEHEFEGHFRDALACASELGAPFEEARALLALGERLRRMGQRVRARRELRLALQRFDALGAEPWARRARTALRATGETVERHKALGFKHLTPQELHVAMAVSDGSTNREIAAALFLSPKTVEFHLGNIYSKLAIRSRTELARLLGETAREVLQN